MSTKKLMEFDDISEMRDVVLDLLVDLTQRGIKFEHNEILKIGMIIGIICRDQEDVFDIETREKLQIISEPFYRDNNAV